MDAPTIIQLISTVGFPGTFAFVLLWLLRRDMQTISKAVTELTITLTRLATLVEMRQRGQDNH